MCITRCCRRGDHSLAQPKPAELSEQSRKVYLIFRASLVLIAASAAIIASGAYLIPSVAIITASQAQTVGILSILTIGGSLYLDLFIQSIKMCCQYCKKTKEVERKHALSPPSCIPPHSAPPSSSARRTGEMEAKSESELRTYETLRRPLETSSLADQFIFIANQWVPKNELQSKGVLQLWQEILSKMMAFPLEQVDQFSKMLNEIQEKRFQCTNKTGLLIGLSIFGNKLYSIAIGHGNTELRNKLYHFAFQWMEEPALAEIELTTVRQYLELVAFFQVSPTDKTQRLLSSLSKASEGSGIPHDKEIMRLVKMLSSK